ncbi:tetratricopeptide repeat protein [Lysobacter sp. CA199]|uniref:tetratricopeptide repeat protein n=1 Tax=Lysobacter sp. CA199 TaxID=3455608 RepID=UPI003F8D2E36
MSAHGTDHLYRMAERYYAHGRVDAAIDALLRLLGEDAEQADAHAFLALCLVKRKRLHAANLEAQRALELAPESGFAHLAAAIVAIARREFESAQSHLLTARESDPDSAAIADAFARLYLAWGRDAQALEHARRACELDPDDPDYPALLASLELRRGDRARAEALARDVLRAHPEHLEALCVLGHCELAAGRTDSARDHAAWALQIDPTDGDALTLMAAVKARRSWLLGLWWRLQSFVSAGSRTRAVTLLLGIFLLYRVALIALPQNGLSQWTGPLSYAWLAFCAYTWIAPGLFWRSLKKELDQVKLRPGF